MYNVIVWTRFKNGSKYFERFLENLKNQTYDSFKVKLCFIDNNDTADELAKLDELLKFKYYGVFNQVVLFDGRNRVLSQATNEFISLMYLKEDSTIPTINLDIDDSISDNYIESFMERVQKDRSNIYQCNIKLVYKDKEIDGFEQKPNTILDDLLEGKSEFPIWGKCIPLEYLHRCYKDVGSPNMDDFTCVLNLALKYGHKWVMNPEATYYFDRTTGGVSQRDFNEEKLCRCMSVMNGLIHYIPKERRIQFFSGRYIEQVYFYVRKVFEGDYTPEERKTLFSTIASLTLWKPLLDLNHTGLRENSMNFKLIRQKGYDFKHEFDIYIK